MTDFKEVFIGIPTKGDMRMELLSPLIEWIGKGATIGISTTQPIDNARNDLVRKFLETKKSYLLFIDSDTIPKEDFLEKLLKADKAIVGAHYNRLFFKGDEMVITSCGVYDYIPDSDNKTGLSVPVNSGLLKVKEFGFGCMLIKREVLEKIGKKWFYFDWDENHEKYRSEDVTFCLNAQKLGYDVWIDTDLKCLHIKTLSI